LHKQRKLPARPQGEWKLYTSKQEQKARNWIPAFAGMTSEKVKMDTSLTRAILALARRASFAVRTPAGRYRHARPKLQAVPGYAE